MAQFVVQNQLTKNCRAGLLLFQTLQKAEQLCNQTNDSHLNGDEIQNHIEYPTPLCFQYTQYGSIPHLEWDLSSKIQDDKAPILFTLSTTNDLQISVHEFNSQQNQSLKGISSFIGIDSSRPSLLALQDTLLNPIKTGYNNKSSVALFSNTGKVSIDTYTFKRITEIFLPTGFQALCDGDTPVDASKKRISHSVERSLIFLDECIQHNNREETKRVNSFILGSVEGGYDLNARCYSAKETSLRPVDGFVIDGFQFSTENSVEPINFKSMKEILNEVLKHLPQDKPRAIFGPLSPNLILHFINNGIDLFDSSFATLVSEKGGALKINFDINEFKLVAQTLDLNDKKYKEDFSVISDDCQCYVCENSFSRAYINHLLNTREMLSYVLLMMHNLHVFYKFFRDVRKLMLDEEKFMQFIKRLD